MSSPRNSGLGRACHRPRLTQRRFGHWQFATSQWTCCFQTFPPHTEPVSDKAATAAAPAERGHCFERHSTYQWGMSLGLPAWMWWWLGSHLPDSLEQQPMTQFAFLYQFKAPIHVSQNVELLRANLKIDSQIVPFKCHVRSFNVETVFQLKYSFWN